MEKLLKVCEEKLESCKRGALMLEDDFTRGFNSGEISALEKVIARIKKFKTQPTNTDKEES